MVTDRAMTHEKAQAWDRLMKSTKTDEEAMLDAYEHLQQLVEKRESMAVKPVTA